MRRIEYRVRGFVQGVNFRSWTASEAKGLGVGGYVQNTTDGSVVGEAVGTTEQLNRFKQLLAKGPSIAKVEGVDISKEESVQGSLSMNFQVRR